MIEEIGTSPKPAWMDLPEKTVYWVCNGWVKRRRFWQKKLGIYLYLQYTAEDAEASAVCPNETWTWDKLPAERCSLSEAIREARIRGLKGVRVESFQDGEWRTVKEYPAGEPLREIE